MKNVKKFTPLTFCSMVVLLFGFDHLSHARQSGYRSESGLPGVTASLQVAPLTIDLSNLTGDSVEKAGVGKLVFEARHEFVSEFEAGGALEVADSNGIIRKADVFAAFSICNADQIDECKGGPYQLIAGVVFRNDNFGKNLSLNEVGAYIEIEEGGSGNRFDRNHRFAFGGGVSKITYPDGFETKAISFIVEGEHKFASGQLLVKGSAGAGMWGVIDNEVLAGAYHNSGYARADASIGYFIVDNRLLASLGATASYFRHGYQQIIPGEYSKDSLPEKVRQEAVVVPNFTISFSPGW